MYGCTCVYDYRCIRMLLPLSLSPSLSFSLSLFLCVHLYLKHVYAHIKSYNCDTRQVNGRIMLVSVDTAPLLYECNSSSSPHTGQSEN